MTIQIKRGTTRTVVLMGKLAFKFPSFRSWKLFLCGLLCNMQETEWSQCFGQQTTKLAPVLFSFWGGWLVVMRRTTPLKEAAWLAFSNDLHLWSRTLHELDDIQFPIEYKRDGFGWLNGEIVAIDYGSSGNVLAHNPASAQ